MKEKVSVLMSVYNAEKYLKTCIDSVLNQSYSNFLFYIINDCSTDGSLAIINSYSDKRIRLIENKENIGLTKSLNKALNIIETEFIARIDADDSCKLNRLATQLNIFNTSKKSLAIVGSSAYLIDERNNQIGEINVEVSNLKEKLFFKNQLIHSSIMIRTNVLKEFKYNEHIKYAQDYNLWIRIAQKYDLTNSDEKLISYRTHSESISLLKKEDQDFCVLPSIDFQLELLGFKNKKKREKLTQIHFKYFFLMNKDLKLKELIKVFVFLKRILILNKRKRIFNTYFNSEIAKLIDKEKGNLIFRLKKKASNIFNKKIIK